MACGLQPGKYTPASLAYFIRVEIYQDRNGKRPLSEWLYGLKDIRTQARIETRLRRVSTGNLGDHKSVGNGVVELRLLIGEAWSAFVIINYSGQIIGQPVFIMHPRPALVVNQRRNVGSKSLV